MNSKGNFQLAFTIYGSKKRGGKLDPGIWNNLNYREWMKMYMKWKATCFHESVSLPQRISQNTLANSSEAGLLIGHKPSKRWNTVKRNKNIALLSIIWSTNQCNLIISVANLFHMNRPFINYNILRQQLLHGGCTFIFLNIRMELITLVVYLIFLANIDS